MVLNRLKTRDRLAKWKMIQETSCVLCCKKEEEWKITLPMSNLWEKLTNRCKFSQVRRKCLSLLLTTLVYFIWKERNSRMFGGVSTDSKKVIQKTQRHVKTQIIYRVQEKKRHAVYNCVNMG